MKDIVSVGNSKPEILHNRVLLNQTSSHIFNQGFEEKGQMNHFSAMRQSHYMVPNSQIHENGKSGEKPSFEITFRFLKSNVISRNLTDSEAASLRENIIKHMQSFMFLNDTRVKIGEVFINDYSTNVWNEQKIDVKKKNLQFIEESPNPSIARINFITGKKIRKKGAGRKTANPSMEINLINWIKNYLNSRSCIIRDVSKEKRGYESSS